MVFAVLGFEDIIPLLVFAGIVMAIWAFLSVISNRNSKAVDRLVGGDVPAAVIALVSSNAAEAFPDIPGYKVFRAPLSPLSMKDGHKTP